VRTGSRGIANLRTLEARPTAVGLINEIPGMTFETYDEVNGKANAFDEFHNA